MTSTPRPKLNARVRPEHFGGLLFSISQVQAIVLNHTGYAIASLLAMGKPLAEIVTSIATEFDVPQETVRADLANFVANLSSRGLLDWQAADTPEVP